MNLFPLLHKAQNGLSLSPQAAPEIKAKILKRLLYKVEIAPQGAILRYFVGRDSIVKVEKSTSPDFFDSECSHTLTNGGGHRRIFCNVL